MNETLLSLALEGKAFGATEVLGPIRFDLGVREIVALVGPSGCGKTTLLRIIGGLDTAFRGQAVWAGGRRAGIGTVFQEPRLLAWRTVAENVALVLADPARAPANDWLKVLGLAAQRDAYPRTLSLGMARRVAIARAFAVAPALVLLDEPFASLDAATAETCRMALLAAWRHRPGAVLLVTHDLAEAASLADRIVLLTAGPARIADVVDIPRGSRRQGIAEGELVAAALRAQGRL